jgi:methylated-DNA-[protein]-cysteine S-methyltransferase
MRKEYLWQLLKKIPKGKVTTYGSLAKKLRTSPRAVGAMLRSNALPDEVSCYKVVCSSGRIGGYALGIREKIRRLRRDGVPVIREKGAWRVACEAMGR